MDKFAWGKVLARFQYDFDGDVLDVVKFNPWRTRGITVLVGDADDRSVRYHCQELYASFLSLQELVIAWIAYKNLGLNQHALVAGISKALECR